MKKIWFSFLAVFLIYGCANDGSMIEGESDGLYSDSGFTSSSAGKTSGSGDNGQTGSGQAGVITAGEWNDLDNWVFLDSLLASQDISKMLNYWSFYTNHRISVKVTNAGANPIPDQEIVLKRDGLAVWSTRTDNRGTAELWLDLYQKSVDVDLSKLQLVLGETVLNDVKTCNLGINNIVLSSSPAVPNNVDIAFVVDATGSMGDELGYLKTELLDVITKAKTQNSEVKLSTASVFYRDEGDEYVTRLSAFTENTNTTIDFIKNQSASGGGDFPEAVHTALDKAINNLQWSSNARTHLLFLVLDAPPHYEPNIVSNLQLLMKKASEKGIKIIPVTASGIDKETEFLMRFMAVTTNGTYVFITNDSGVGGEHLKPTIGKYDVEFLNALMLRLINKYIKYGISL